MRINLESVKAEIARILKEIPALAEDEQFRADMLEAETPAFETISTLADLIGDNDVIIDGLGERISGLSQRRSRYKDRNIALRKLITSIMGAGNLRKVELQQATISMRNNAPKLVGGADPETLPERFVIVELSENRAAIKEALQNGESIEGYALSNAEPSLTIRIK